MTFIIEWLHKIQLQYVALVSTGAVQRPKWEATLTNMGGNSHSENNYSEEISDFLILRVPIIRNGYCLCDYEQQTFTFWMTISQDCRRLIRQNLGRSRLLSE